VRQLTDLKFGCTANGATHQDTNIPDITTKIRMVKDAGVFDYIDRTPPDEEFRDTLKASEKYDLPVLASGWFYTLGRDESLYEQNIMKGRLLGTKVHNVQVMTKHADGHVLTNDEVADFYMRAHDFGMRHGVVPCFEVHVNMWSEHLGRVEQVAAIVKKRGVPFYMTLDHSHVIFKIDNPKEQLVQDMKADVDSGKLILDPAKPGNVAKKWIDSNFVHHAHARCAVPANPINTMARHPDGSYGRGIQYPFFRPKPGEYVTDAWDEKRIEPWKRVVRDLLAHHATHDESPIGQISCEHIPAIDYGAGHKYSIFEQNVACAKWMREEWAKALTAAKSTTH